MKSILKYAWLSVLAVLVYAGCSNHACAAEQEAQENNNLVGRIAHIEGQLLRYVPDEDDWVLTDVDTPFGVFDNLFSSEDGKVEVIMPNNTLARIGGDTQIQLITLTSGATEISVSSGTARLYNKSQSVEILATTPFGDVIMPPETVCDIFVHENQAELVSIKGTVEFIKTGSDTRHELIGGSSSIIINAEQIVASTHSVSPVWDAWNVDRDVQWTRRMQARGDSEKYLPESLQDHAWELEGQGRWERVYYEGSYSYFWRPVYVSAGWTPFSSGRWIVWHGEHTWVPCEPFGYVTHHYGNWVFASGYWYWAPPVSHVMVSTGAPFLNIGMCWYPGRVAWLSSSISVGWFPLAPFEMYYSNRYWGPRCRVRNYHHYYDYRGYRHYRHTRFIGHDRFYGQKNYRHAGLRSMRRGEKFWGSARFPEKVRRNYKDRDRHRYASNMPRYRERIKKIDVRFGKRDGLESGSRVNRNPFKRRDMQRIGSIQGPEKRITAYEAKKTVKKSALVNKGLKRQQQNVSRLGRTDSVATKQYTRGRTNTSNENLARTKKTDARIVKNTGVTPRKARASVSSANGKRRQKLATVSLSTQGRRSYSKKAVSSRDRRQGSTGRVVQANRAQKNTMARSLTRPSNKPARQNNTAAMQKYVARGRRW